ncbi:MAG: hydrogenase maturation protease [Caldisericia bacterium]
MKKLYNASHKPKGEIVFEEANLGGLALLDIIDGFDKAILVDSISSGEYPVGTFLKLTLEDFTETRHISSMHDINFATALEMGDKMGHKIPPEFDIYAVEIKPALDFMAPLSPELEEIIPKVVREIAKRSLGIII